MKKIGFLVFAIALVLGVVLSNLSSMKRLGKDGIDLSFDHSAKEGSGIIVTEQRNVEAFRSVESSGILIVEILVGPERSVEVEADDNLLPYIETDVRRGVLHLSTKGKIRPSGSIRVRIHTDELAAISGSGASEISVSGLENAEFTVDASGASKVTIAGRTTSLRVEGSGASRIDACGLNAQDVTAGVSGASEAKVTLNGVLNARSSGAAKIIYAGSPMEINKRTSGAGKVTPAE